MNIDFAPRSGVSDEFSYAHC